VIDLHAAGGSFVGALRDLLNAARDLLVAELCCSTAEAIEAAMSDI
jgi:hypothetical protein